MGLASQRTAIVQHFHTNWDELNGKVAYPNKTFVTPPGEAFLVFSLLDYFKSRRSIGMQQWVTRREGAVQVDIYIPEGMGIGPAKEKAELVEDMFESIDVVTQDGEVIRFRTPYTRNVAANEQRAANLEDSYLRVVVTCDFYVDEVKGS